MIHESSGFTRDNFYALVLKKHKRQRMKTTRDSESGESIIQEKAQRELLSDAQKNWRSCALSYHCSVSQPV